MPVEWMANIVTSLNHALIIATPVWFITEVVILLNLLQEVGKFFIIPDDLGDLPGNDLLFFLLVFVELSNYFHPIRTDAHKLVGILMTNELNFLRFLIILISLALELEFARADIGLIRFPELLF